MLNNIIQINPTLRDENKRKLPLGTPGGSLGAKNGVSSELAYPADPKELPECRNSCGTAGGATFFAVAAGFGGRDIPPTEIKKQS